MRLRRIILIALFAIAIVTAGAAVGGYRWLAANVLVDVPRDLLQLREYRPPSNCIIYDVSGVVVDRFGIERRIWMDLDALPDHVWQAFVAAEDRRFFEHSGVDLTSIARAMWRNLRAGGIQQGGSTITQQLVKNLVVGAERSYKRKIREAALSLAIERELGKRELLELYVNYVYLGSGNYGVEAAARSYFGVPAASLTHGQAALIAGLVSAPSRYAPDRHPEAAKRRRDLVLAAMREEGYVDAEVYASEREREIELYFEPQNRDGPHGPVGVGYVTEVRRQIRDLFGTTEPFRHAFHVYTALDSKIQRVAETALRRAIDVVEERHLEFEESEGWREVAVEEPSLTEGAMVVLENATGRVVAMVGGYRDTLAGFNRATRAMRQPGSSFKPYVYASALLRGYNQLDRVLDGRLSLPRGGGKRWKPRNFSGYHGRVTLRHAISRSLNTAAVRIALDVGADRIVETARRMGVATPLRAEPTLALGASEVTPLDQAVGFSTIARMGSPAEPVLIDRIHTAAGGELIGTAGSAVRVGDTELGRLPGGPRRRALPAPIAYELADMMREVVRAGTARRAYDADYDRAGKTGTTNNFVDAWFVGFSPRYTVSVWIGRDGHETLGKGETGGRAALPAWLEVMEALSHEKGERFALPDDAVLVRYNNEWLGFPRGAVPESLLTRSKPSEAPLALFPEKRG